MTTGDDAKEDANRRLLAAVRSGDLGQAAAALADGADARCEEQFRDLGRPEYESGFYAEETPALHIACSRKDLAMVRLLLEHGAHPKSVRTVDGTSASSRWESCLFAALPDVPSQVDVSALILEVLLLKGADPNNPRRESDRETLLLDDARVKQTPRLAEVLKRFGARSREAGPGARS